MSASTSGSRTATGSVTLTKLATDTVTFAHIAGTYGTVNFVFEGSLDGTNFVALSAIRYDTNAGVNGTISPSDNAEQAWIVPSAGLITVRARVTAIASGTAEFVLSSFALVGQIPVPQFSSTAIGAATGTSLAVSGAITSSGTGGVGYATGAGGTVSQATDRTTGVTLNKITGTVTTQATSLAAGAVVTHTVTNSTVAATDVVVLTKVSGDADTHAWVNAVGAGSFNVTLHNTHASGADTTAFVYQFAVIKSVAA